MFSSTQKDMLFYGNLVTLRILYLMKIDGCVESPFMLALMFLDIIFLLIDGEKNSLFYIAGNETFTVCFLPIRGWKPFHSLHFQTIFCIEKKNKNKNKNAANKTTTKLYISCVKFLRLYCQYLSMYCCCCITAY